MQAQRPPFAFVQLELPGVLGPADGRYVVRDRSGERPERVLVLRTLGAVEHRRLPGRRARTAAPEPHPAPLPATRATVIATPALSGEAAARRWLASARRAPDDHVSSALAVINRALHAHAIAAADPGVAPAARIQALVVRLGWGPGEQVADGRWSQAIEVPPPSTRRRRADALPAQERLAALLGGRDDALAAESLALRARLDLEQGRIREAALELRVAVEAGIAELAADAAGASLGTRLGRLGEQREVVDAVAEEALHGPLSAGSRDVVGGALRELEAALRARALAVLRPRAEAERRPPGPGPAPAARPRRRR